MASSSAGSDVFALLALIVICLGVLLILRHFLPLRTTPAYLTVPVFLALALPASIILLVPIDLASHAVEDNGQARGIYLPDRLLLVAWRITYWLTFVLTWFILPILGDYVDAGYREPKKRFIYALRSNIRYQLIILACGIAGLIYLIVSSKFRGNNIKGLVMALAYAWGLILAIYLMGHGLVAVPRRLFKSANISGRLKTVQTFAPVLHERMTDAIMELDELEGQVLLLTQRKTGTARDFQEWIEELADTSEIPENRVSMRSTAQSQDVHIPAVITERYMADLTRKLKRARHKRIRFIEEWDYLIQEASDLQTILDSVSSRKLDFGKSSSGGVLLWHSSYIRLTPTMRYHLFVNVLPKLRLLFSGIFALASACIIWSEVFKAVRPSISIVGLSIVHHPKDETNGKIGFGGQVMSAAWLSYMCIAALTSVREVKVWGNRALVRRHTYGESACWYACQVAKLTVPLSYNFVTLTSGNISSKTIFDTFFGDLINFTPLGSGFSTFFPIFVIVPALATGFHLYSRIGGLFGLGVFAAGADDEDAENGPYGGWREGRALIERELHGNVAGGLTSRGHSPRPVGQASLSASASGPRTASPPLLLSPSFDTAPSLTTTTTTALTSSTREDRQSLLNNPSSNIPPRRTPSNRTTTLPTANADADPEENIFTSFAHRFQNTLDTAEPPEFLRNLGAGLGRRPKWMGGANGSEDASGRADVGGGLGRWFGGRPDDGRVRL